MEQNSNLPVRMLRLDVQVSHFERLALRAEAVLMHRPGIVKALKTSAIDRAIGLSGDSVSEREHCEQRNGGNKSAK
jgi:hypothetical protein